MAIYFKDDLVLFVDDLVATSTDCCCGCSDCHFFFNPFPDIFGNCFTTQECDGSLSGPVPCASKWLYFEQRCVGAEIDCTELCNISIIDPSTCDSINTCDCCDCCGDCVNGTVNSVTHEVTPCIGACCTFGICTTGTFFDCDFLGGIYLGGGTDCDPNPC